MNKRIEEVYLQNYSTIRRNKWIISSLISITLLKNNNQRFFFINKQKIILLTIDLDWEIVRIICDFYLKK